MTHNKITSITRFQNFIFTYKIQLKISKINTLSRVRKGRMCHLIAFCLFLVDTQIKGVAADEHFLMYYCRNKNSGVQDEVKNL